MTAEMTQSNELIETPLETPTPQSNVGNSLAVKSEQSISSTNGQWRQFGDTTSAYITNFQNSIGEFFQQYQSLLATLGWILSALISVKVLLAVLDAINDIPLLGLFLELVGIGYTIWFVSRYLLTATSRQALTGELNNFKKQVFKADN
jgi:hypothetical protein